MRLRLSFFEDGSVHSKFMRFKDCKYTVTDRLLIVRGSKRS